MSPKLGPNSVRLFGMTMSRRGTSAARDALLILAVIAVACVSTYVVWFHE